MAITILELLSENAEGAVVRLRHAQSSLIARVAEDAHAVRSLIGKETVVELGYERVTAWQVFSSFDDERSAVIGLEASSCAARITGRVHQVLELEDGGSLIDIYLQTGAEFLSVHSEELGGHVPAIDSGLAVEVEGLCFYPTRA